MIEPLIDANIVGNPWWLFADPAVLPAFNYGYLDSEPGPRVKSRVGFEIEGIEIVVAEDFYVAALEPKAAFRNAGA